MALLFAAMLLLTAPANAEPHSMDRSKSESANTLPPVRPLELSRPDTLPAGAPRAAREGDSPSAPRDDVHPEARPGCLLALQARFGKGVQAAAASINATPNLACRVVEPVVVQMLELGENRIAFQPPATLSCEMAGRVATWLSDSVQLLLRGSFQRELTGLRVGGGHECRRRNRAGGGPLSEHATGRALDIFAFVMAGPAADARIVVEKPDGPRQQQFLTAIRQSACGAFTTSIGPGADTAHANHLHLDIQERRSAATRFCQ